MLRRQAAAALRRRYETSTMQYPPITLRYFDARGRAQFLRYYFRARKIPYTDERVPLSADFAAWMEIRDDRSRTGPFRKLPVLQWGDRLLAETLMIAAFVHEASGDAGGINDDDNLRHGMLTSSLAIDVSLPLSMLLWSEVHFPGSDLAAVAKRNLERLKQHFQSIEQSLVEWRWLERARGRRVMLADCLLWEEIDIVRTIFGPHFPLDATPAVAKFYAEFAGRAACEAVLAEKPCPITARPNESEVIEKIQQALG
jgi:glutathione S-transferase